MTEDFDPLPAETWFERIAMIANGELASTENALRHALHLLQLTPREFRPREYGSIDESNYEALLEGGNLEAAARCLVAMPTLDVTTSANAAGARVAITCRTTKMTVHGEGDSAAAAIVQAWAKSFLALRSEFGMRRLHQAFDYEGGTDYSLG